MLWASLDGRGNRWGAVAVVVGGVVGGLLLSEWLATPVLVEVSGWVALGAAVGASATVGGLVRSDPLPPRGASAASRPSA